MTGFSFEMVDAVDYEELRPGYSAEAVEWVVQRGRLQAGDHVVDLAAGTGQLARHLTAFGFDIVAVEPATNMRAKLETIVPSVRTVDAVAEAFPFEDGSVDGVVVGNAFHHFDRDARSPSSAGSSHRAGSSRSSGPGRSRRSNERSPASRRSTTSSRR